MHHQNPAYFFTHRIPRQEDSKFNINLDNIETQSKTNTKTDRQTQFPQILAHCYEPIEMRWLVGSRSRSGEWKRLKKWWLFPGISGDGCNADEYYHLWWCPWHLNYEDKTIAALGSVSELDMNVPSIRAGFHPQQQDRRIHCSSSLPSVAFVSSHGIQGYETLWGVGRYRVRPQWLLGANNIWSILYPALPLARTQ